MACTFFVFKHLALPALIGMTFLDATETLTAFTSRLIALPSGWKKSFRLLSLGSTTTHVTCKLNACEVVATADTGAEIALVSGDFAQMNGFRYELGCEELELADGSKEYTTGFGNVELSIWKARLEKDPGRAGSWVTRTVKFHVLDTLVPDVVLDEDIIEDYKIFQEGLAFFMTNRDGEIAGLGPIAHLRTSEKSAVIVKDKLKIWASSLGSAKPTMNGMIRTIL
jgi:hypothetical protein